MLSSSPCVTKSRFSLGYLSARALITLAYLILAPLTDSPHLGTCSGKRTDSFRYIADLRRRADTGD